MVHRQQTSNAFTFVRVAALRTVQLTKGCTPRVQAGHRHSITAQLEVAAGKIELVPLVGVEDGFSAKTVALSSPSRPMR